MAGLGDVAVARSVHSRKGCQFSHGDFASVLVSQGSQARSLPELPPRMHPEERSGSCQAHLARTTSSGSIRTEMSEEEEGRGGEVFCC